MNDCRTCGERRGCYYFISGKEPRHCGCYWNSESKNLEKTEVENMSIDIKNLTLEELEQLQEQIVEEKLNRRKDITMKYLNEFQELFKRANEEGVSIFRDVEYGYEEIDEVFLNIDDNIVLR